MYTKTSLFWIDSISKGCNKISAALALLLFSQVTFAATSYTYSPDGSEVTDSATGLVWRRCSEGQTWSGNACSGIALAYTHQAALQRANSQFGWRLPNVKELSSLTNKANNNPAIDFVAFPSTISNFYWSASPYSGDGSYPWVVSFHTGASLWGYVRTDGYYVRLVR